jgi:anaerobic dimethyl sulfoxide reductase subunit B (iron-sulfur subunit)
VKVFNERGTIISPCRLSKRIMPGVVDIPQGASWTPDKDGVDRRGSTNVLTSERWTPLAFGNTQQTIMVQVERVCSQDSSQSHEPSSQIHPIPRQPVLSEAKQTSQMAFFFDATACTSCKTCQTACKSRNSLPIGILWRRVYEIAGGSWQNGNMTWNQDLFAYNLSMACNHCEKPICVEVCPTKALFKREDGIVLIDASRCIGCQYCSWVCPYDALQFNADGGYMTKCTFCVEEIDAGKPPTCVAACPMRALDYGDKQALIEKYGLQGTRGVFPLPDGSYTNPSFLIRAHRNSSRAEKEPVQITNREEV